MKTFLVLDGSSQGKSGNTALPVRLFLPEPGPEFNTYYLELKDCNVILVE